MAAVDLIAEAAFEFLPARLPGKYFLEVKIPGTVPVASAVALMTVAGCK